jgi:hypothetical protein
VAWSAWAANAAPIPSTCADGTAGTPFAASVPNVTLFADDWRAPRSLRSSLGWSGPVLGNRLNGNVEGTLSRNTRQAGFVDLNVATVPRFTLAAEDGRPVFVPAASIVPGTGATTARDARVSPLFQRVAEQRSDLGSTSQQLRVGVSPFAFSTRFGWSLSYVWQNVRERTRGFQSSAGDPWAVERSRAAFDPRHQVVYSLNWNIADAVRLSWFGNIRSGLPFTPVVGGDVNGDGYQNDRAFVFAPDAVRPSDPALADAMQGLLDGGPGIARACLRRQLGMVAARNGCTGPWTQTANLQVALNPLKFRMPQRTTLSFALSNPLGAVDRLLHGEAGQRGWGQTPQPDASLLYVRGFDAERQRWRYEVNQRFGATRPQVSAFRQPVTLTMMLRVDVGPTRERQNLTQALDRGRRLDGQKAPEPFLRAMYGSGGLQNPLAQILRQADTLRLDGRQADSIATLNRWYTVRVDSIWAPLMKEFAALPDDYAHDTAYDRYRTARRATVDLLARLAPDVRALLTAEQRRRLPPMVASLLDTRYLAAIRSGTAGAGGLPMFGGTGGFGGGMGGGGPMGGGNQTVIIR